MRITNHLGRAALVASAVLSITGCGPTTYYDWGSYEGSVQHHYSAQREAKVFDDRQKLIEEVKLSEVEGRRVPPGKYAQIGYLSFLTGDKKSAASYFAAERNAYPESTKLMNEMIARLQ